MSSIIVPEKKVSPTWLLIRRILAIVSIIFLVFFALLEIMPFVLTIANSFKCLPAVQQFPQSFIPIPPFGIDCQTAEGVSRAATETTGTLSFNPTLEGYNRIFEFPFGLWFRNTVIYALCVTILRLIFDSMAGYALARLNFAGNRVVFYIMLGTMMIPGIVLVIPRFIILRQLGMINTYQGVIITLAADAFGIFMMKQFFESIPKEIEEAAMVDGASRLTIFWRIVLPMATPALTALTIFSFQGTWNNFMDILIINNGAPDLYNLPLGMALLRGQFGDTLIWNLFLAGAVMTTLPLAVVFFVFQRYFVEGISYSGLKG
jgi:multiple sugar transport system permease protein